MTAGVWHMCDPEMSSLFANTSQQSRREVPVHETEEPLEKMHSRRHMKRDMLCTVVGRRHTSKLDGVGHDDHTGEVLHNPWASLG